MTALVGPSGGGKSTILNLMLRFYETQRRRSSSTARTITAVSRHSLRQQIAYVGQDVYPVPRHHPRATSRFGKPDATEDEIIAAAKAAYAHDFIMCVPARLRHAGRRTRHCSFPAASASASPLRAR